MQTGLTFDDVSLIPADFSTVESREFLHTNAIIGTTTFKLPILSSNMTSVFTPKLANELYTNGGLSIVHRFCTIEENINLFKQSSIYGKPWVSVGTSKHELERAEALASVGAEVFVLDVAMGNNITTVTQYNELVKLFPNHSIVVSDFSTSRQIKAFLGKVQKTPTAFTLGQGVGSACITRQVTGIGVPAVTAIMDCVSSQQNIILNGGIRYPGDFCKALALGVKAVIIGRLFAQCRESSDGLLTERVYSGSASKESYELQNKVSSFRAPEGESYLVTVNNTVENLMNTFNGALRSSMSYLNATNLVEYRQNAKFMQVTNAGSKESGAYGKY